jgi:hypothetical protein
MRKMNEAVTDADTRVITICADKALNTLARLIGRQMANEQFEIQSAQAPLSRRKQRSLRVSRPPLTIMQELREGGRDAPIADRHGEQAFLRIARELRPNCQCRISKQIGEPVFIRG